MVGDEPLAREMSEMLYNEGIFAQAIVYPTVAKGKARLRVIYRRRTRKKTWIRLLLLLKKSAGRPGLLTETGKHQL